MNEWAEVSPGSGELFDGHVRDNALGCPPGVLLTLGSNEHSGRSGTAARRALWFVGLLVLLVGIVAMHGMNSHGGGMDPSVHAVATHAPASAPLAAGQGLMAASGMRSRLP